MKYLVRRVFIRRGGQLLGGVESSSEGHYWQQQRDIIVIIIIGALHLFNNGLGLRHSGCTCEREHESANFMVPSDSRVLHPPSLIACLSNLLILLHFFFWVLEVSQS